MVEMASNEVLPRTYTQAELLKYLALCRQRCQETIAALTPEAAQRQCRFGWGEPTFGELMLYTLRHVQEHGAQLRVFLSNHAGISVETIPRVA